jgi:hypothetical protein
MTLQRQEVASVKVHIYIGHAGVGRYSWAGKKGHSLSGRRCQARFVAFVAESIQERQDTV